MKPGPNFKMKQQTKRFLAGHRGVHNPKVLKRLMIQAQLFADVVVKMKSSKEKDAE